ncbi:hypothetical protein [Mesorhizobium sp. Root172]|uniref:hypothetical protein n=1 Tax=Mesorhizobium sp. Root172 TaxID=1736481 RepID=UPI0006FAEB85|nr:hypothetical protein [Mesorhizobium sp. Root172]KRB22715.1 hypothetical protein ASE05_16165 [Mesorhizobium sp. Root172]
MTNEKPTSPTQGELAVKALTNLAHEMRFLLRNNPKFDGGLYRQRLDEAEAVIAQSWPTPCPHNCDLGGVCLAEHAGHPKSCPLSALDRTTLPPTEGWRPIETAPRDGSKFLAYEKGHYFDCWWHENGYGEAYWMDEADSEPAPSDWMPLPAAPQGKRT